MNQNEAFHRIVTYLELDRQEFDDYIAEDDIGGYSPVKEERTFKGPWTIESQIVYALVRCLKPLHTLEIGNLWGNSTHHIAAAIAANGEGQFTSIDKVAPVKQTKPYPIDIDFQIMNVKDWDFAVHADVDFIFEDSAHNATICEHVWKHFSQHAPSGAVIVSHDSEHFIMGPGVREGIERVIAHGRYLSLLIDPGLCGLAMWRKP